MEDSMFCQNCGAKIEEGTSFCNMCGNAVVSSQKEDKQNSLIGFSTKINDPAFESYKKKSIAWSFIFSGILAIIAIIAFPIYGNASGDIDWPYSLLYGFGIGGMFVMIALLQTLKKKFEKTFDGVVTYKDSYILRKRSRNGHVDYSTIYIIKVKKDSGGVKKHKWRNIPGPYNYYNVGDRVRHHKGFYYYEKYDKSKDTQIMCAACMSFHDINKDICPKCKCPLLK